MSNKQIKSLSGDQFPSTEGLSILDSALQSHLVYEYSCKNGQCGVCKTKLIEGTVTELQQQLALTDQERDNGYILSCCCQPETDILINAENLSALADIEIRTLPAKISEIKKISEQIVQVKLRFPPNINFTFLEGQFIDVIYNGVRRSYSIANISTESEICLLIKKVANGVLSEYWFNHAKTDDLLRIEGPLGTFFLRDSTRPLILLATGTGIAPIKAILEQLDKQAEQQKLNVPVSLFWGNRFAEDFIWQPGFKNLQFEYTKVLSKLDESWVGEVGYIQDAVLKKCSQELNNCSVYACGSNEMIKAAKMLFVKSGLPENEFHSDAFVQSY